MSEIADVPNDQNDLAAEVQGQKWYRFIKYDGADYSKDHDDCWQNHHACVDAILRNVRHSYVCFGLPIEVYALHHKAKDQKSALDYEYRADQGGHPSITWTCAVIALSRDDATNDGRWDDGIEKINNHRVGIQKVSEPILRQKYWVYLDR